MSSTLADIAISLWPRESPSSARSLSWPTGKPGISNSSLENWENIPFRTMPIPGLKALSDAGSAAGAGLALSGAVSFAIVSMVESWASSAAIRASYSRLRA